MLFGSAKIQLNDLTDTQRNDLRQLAELSREMYNCCTTVIIQHYEDTGRVLNYAELNRIESATLSMYNELSGQAEGRPMLAFTLNGGTIQV